MSLAAEAPPRPRFPPLWRGEGLRAGADPFEAARAAARADAEPGRLFYCEDEDTMRAAVVLAPELPLEAAMGALFAVTLGLADALGSLAPPEVAVHAVWADRLEVNGAECAWLRAAASHQDPAKEPDWLVIGVEVLVRSGRRDRSGPADATTLHDEGCGEIDVATLLESWSRHMLAWINRLTSDGFAPLRTAWIGRCRTLGQAVASPCGGTFLDIDEHGAMLLRRGEATERVPLTMMLEP